MTTLAFDGNKLSIGKNFVDAVTNKKPRSKGEISTNQGVNYNWQSTYDITKTEKILRESVASEGARVTYFKSQSC